jgi:hypothetical protein
MQGLGGSGHLAMMDLDILGTASAMAVLAKYGVEGCGSPFFVFCFATFFIYDFPFYLSLLLACKTPKILELSTSGEFLLSVSGYLFIPPCGLWGRMGYAVFV